MFNLPKLSFEKKALVPYISEETINYHYNKHHQTYVDNLNKLIVWTDFENMSLENIIKNSTWTIFNNAAQIWNHTFYFDCLWSSKETKSELKKLIIKFFWNYDSFQKEFTSMALDNFGSWWTWLVITPKNDLKIISTSNANTVLNTQNKALLVIDVWEHAYYIDYRNNRAKYIEWFFKIINS